MIRVSFFGTFHLDVLFANVRRNFAVRLLRHVFGDEACDSVTLFRRMSLLSLKSGRTNEQPEVGFQVFSNLTLPRASMRGHDRWSVGQSEGSSRDC